MITQCKQCKKEFTIIDDSSIRFYEIAHIDQSIEDEEIHYHNTIDEKPMRFCSIECVQAYFVAAAKRSYSEPCMCINCRGWETEKIQDIRLFTLFRCKNCKDETIIESYFPIESGYETEFTDEEKSVIIKLLSDWLDLPGYKDRCNRRILSDFKSRLETHKNAMITISEQEKNAIKNLCQVRYKSSFQRNVLRKIWRKMKELK